MPRLFLGNLGHDCRDRDVEKFFRGYGDLKHVNIKGLYGFVEMDDKRDAEDAIRDLNGKSFNGGRIRIEFAQGNDRGGDRDRRGGGWDRRDRGDNHRGRQISDGKFKRTNYRLVVENLSSRTSWQDLKDFMRKAGDITYTTVNRGTRGEGLVEFSDREGMEYALKELDDTKLDGSRIRLKEERKDSRSRSRSNRRGNRRSRSKRSPSRSRDRRSREKSRNHKSSTPDEKRRNKSGSEDWGRNGDKNMDRRSRSQERRSRQRSKTPEERSRSRSNKHARNSDRGSHGRQASRTPEKSRSRSRSGNMSRNEENNGRYASRSPRSGSERD